MGSEASYENGSVCRSSLGGHYLSVVDRCTVATPRILPDTLCDGEAVLFHWQMAWMRAQADDNDNYDIEKPDRAIQLRVRDDPYACRALA